MGFGGRMHPPQNTEENLLFRKVPQPELMSPQQIIELERIRITKTIGTSPPDWWVRHSDALHGWFAAPTLRWFLWCVFASCVICRQLSCIWSASGNARVLLLKGLLMILILFSGISAVMKSENGFEHRLREAARLWFFPCALAFHAIEVYAWIFLRDCDFTWCPGEKRVSLDSLDHRAPEFVSGVYTQEIARIQSELTDGTSAIRIFQERIGIKEGEAQDARVRFGMELKTDNLSDERRVILKEGFARATERERQVVHVKLRLEDAQIRARAYFTECVELVGKLPGVMSDAALFRKHLVQNEENFEAILKADQAVEVLVKAINDRLAALRAALTLPPIDLSAFAKDEFTDMLALAQRVFDIQVPPPPAGIYRAPSP